MKAAKSVTPNHIKNITPPSPPENALIFDLEVVIETHLDGKYNNVMTRRINDQTSIVASHSLVRRKVVLWPGRKKHLQGVVHFLRNSQWQDYFNQGVVTRQFMLDRDPSLVGEINKYRRENDLWPDDLHFASVQNDARNLVRRYQENPGSGFTPKELATISRQLGPKPPSKFRGGKKALQGPRPS